MSDDTSKAVAEVQRNKAFDVFKQKYSHFWQRRKPSDKLQQKEKDHILIASKTEQSPNPQNIHNKQDIDHPKNDKSAAISLLKNNNDHNHDLDDNELKEPLDQNGNNKHNEWQCDECTFIQSIDNKYCELCSNYNTQNGQKADDTLQQQKRMKADEQLAVILQMAETKRTRKKLSIIEYMMGVRSNDNGYCNIYFGWQRLPIHVLKARDVNVLHKSEENKSCSICMAEWKIGDKTRQLPCFHLFHKKCIDQWFQKQNEKGNDASCPLDRKKIKDAVAQK